MYQSRDSLLTTAPKPLKYDIIDMDPYGSAIPFIDATIQAVNDGGNFREI